MVNSSLDSNHKCNSRNLDLYFIMRKRLKSLFLLNGKIFPILFLDKKLQNMAQLTQEQRYTISVMIKQNEPQAENALTNDKCISVVCRELKRNCDKRNVEYRSDY